MEKFEKDILRGMIGKGNLRAAMAYLEQFPETAALYQKGVALYQQEHYLTYDVDAELNAILLVYQNYYRDVFYLELPAEEAAQRLRKRLAELFQAAPDSSLDDLEEMAGTAFRRKSLHALMGRTSGYYGPYIWKAEELRHYAGLRCEIIGRIHHEKLARLHFLWRDRYRRLVQRRRFDPLRQIRL